MERNEMNKAVVTVVAMSIIFGLWKIEAKEQKPVLSPPIAVAPETKENLPQYNPQVAWSSAAKVWLVVWEDGWAASDETAREGRAQDIFASRVSVDGKILDPNGIEVCIARDFQGLPVVASDGKDFLVLWQDMRNGKDWDIYAARVTADGKVLDPNGFLVCGGEHNQCMPSVVWTGNGYYAVWLDARNFPEYRVRGMRLSREGKGMDDSPGIELIRPMTDADIDKWRKASFAPGKHGQGWHNVVLQPHAPVLTANDKVCLVLSYASGWTGGTGEGGRSAGYLLRRIDVATGKPSGPVENLALEASVESARWFPAVSTQVYHPALCATGEHGFLLTAYFHHHGFGADGNGVRVAYFFDREGQPRRKGNMLSVRLIVREPHQHGVGYRTYGVRPNTLALAWDGKRALHVADRYIVSGNRVDFDYDILGIFIDAEGKRLLDLRSCTTVESDRIRYNDASRKVEEEQAQIEPFLIAGGEGRQSRPAVAGGDEGIFLVVWQEEIPGKNSRIVARLVEAR
jgi:hypothetical protein